MTLYEQDPNDALDYPFDWSSWLTSAGNDTIQSSQFIADSGIMVESDAILSDTRTAVWLSGGTENRRYGVTNRIVTAGDRTKDWTIYVLVKGQ